VSAPSAGDEPSGSTRTAWVLNLDADLELAASVDGRPVRYAATAAVRAAMVPHVERLAASLLGPEDVRIDASSPPDAAKGFVGRAFCPTSRAIASMRRAGAVPEPHPPQDVLRAVNSRAFCASLGQTLPGAVFARDLEAALVVLASSPEVARSWRLKRAFGMAGRGQRVIAPGPLDQTDLAFLRAGFAEGGVQVEPNVAIEHELGVHGMLAEDGSVRLGRLVAQQCDSRGQWLASTIATDVEPAIGDAIMASAREVAVALRAAKYFGPFGVDAFVYRDLGGARRLQPRSEINARYSMGFAIGLPR
jgi:hypothetical protein